MNAKDRKRIGTKPYSYPQANPTHKGTMGNGGGAMQSKGTVGTGSVGGNLAKGAMGQCKS